MLTVKSYVNLTNGEQRTFLEDGANIMRNCKNDAGRIDFDEVIIPILPEDLQL